MFKDVYIYNYVLCFLFYRHQGKYPSVVICLWPQGMTSVTHWTRQGYVYTVCGRMQHVG